MYCTNCGNKVEEGVKFCGSCGANTEDGKLASKTVPVEYFSITTGRLVLFSILTFNLYNIYWFYRNWKAVKKADSSDIWPIPRGLFAIFFCHSLFDRVLESAKSNGYTETYSVQWLATAYIVLLIVGNVWGRMESLGAFDVLILIVLLPLTVLPLLPIQRAINFNNKKVGAADTEKTGFSGGEVILIVIGVLFLLLSVWGMLIPE